MSFGANPYPGDHVSPRLILSKQGAAEQAHELKMAKTVPADLPAWMVEQIAKDAELIDVAFGPKRFPKQDDGLGKKISCTELREGARVCCSKGLTGYGRLKEADSIAAGSIGIVQKVSKDWTASVLFHDADTGECKTVDCFSTDLRWPMDGEGEGA